LKSSVHCKEAYSKANRIMLGLMSRTIKYRNPKSLINLYKSLVRPHLDHCSTVWNPHYKKDIIKGTAITASFHASSHI